MVIQTHGKWYRNKDRTAPMGITGILNFYFNPENGDILAL
jgi:hypothetical protein